MNSEKPMDIKALRLRRRGIVYTVIGLVMILFWFGTLLIAYLVGLHFHTFDSATAFVVGTFLILVIPGALFLANGKPLLGGRYGPDWSTY